MNSIAQHLAEKLNVHCGVRISKIEHEFVKDSESPKYKLLSEKDETFGPFDLVILTAPSLQTLSLFPSLVIIFI